MIVADTDVLIDFFTAKGEANKVERLLDSGVLVTTVISRFELLSGAKSLKQRARIMDFLDAVPSLTLDDSAADSGSEIRRALERTGASIGMADSLIAGIVITHRGTLLTRNRRHFERVPGLKLA